MKSFQKESGISKDFYDNNSYYQEKILKDNNNLITNNNITNNNNKNLIILYNEPQKRLKNILENTENNINNWKKAILDEFELFNTHLAKLKNYINEYNEISENPSLSMKYNMNNSLKNNFSQNKDEESQEKYNKTILNNQYNNTFFQNNSETIDLIFKK